MFKSHYYSRQNCCSSLTKRKQKKQKRSQCLTRSLRLESLEDRRVLALVGVAPDLPLIGYNSGGTVGYDQVSNLFSLSATPLSYQDSVNSGSFAAGSVNLNIEVDESGALVGGTPGDDFVLAGDVDVDDDFVVDYSGILLTGEIQEFGSQDSGGGTDFFDFRFVVTGGLLAAQFGGLGASFGVTTTSENSNFEGSFEVGFGGNAKGSLGALEADIEPGRLSGTKLSEITNCECDKYGNPIKTSEIVAHEGVTINLYLDANKNGILDDVVYASTETDEDGNWAFDNLDAGVYFVQEVIPDGYIALTPDTVKVELEAGEEVADIDFFNKQVRASVGNYFFIDTNENGIQDVGDLGVNGVTVKLLDSKGNLLETTTTDFDSDGNAGYYLFYNLDAGNYIIEFVVPTGVSFTLKDVNGNSRDAEDSDANSNGRTNVFSLATNEHRRDIDAGVKPEVCVESKVYKVKDYFDYCQKAKAGQVKGVTLEYNPTSEELYVEVKVKTYDGRLADGFTIVIDSGAAINGYTDENTLAVFYFDATRSDPVLNVFGFNSREDATSFRDSNGNLSSADPNRIATSKDNSSGWVKELAFSTYNGLRTFKFRIDASDINDGGPLSKANWEGTGFGKYASFDLDTFDGLTTAYSSNGFLTKWNYCYHGYMEACKVETCKTTVCTEVEIDSFFDEWGWEATKFKGNSNGNPLDDISWDGSADAFDCDCEKDCGKHQDDCNDHKKGSDLESKIKCLVKILTTLFSKWC